MAFVFGDVTLTVTPEDIETIWLLWMKEHPGKKISDMPSAEFADRLMEHIKANAKPTRTVLHN
jgi:hypothetical protein